MVVVTDISTVPARRRRRLSTLLLVSVVIAIGLTLCAKGRGYKTWVFRQAYPEYGVHHYAAAQPSVLRTRPADREGNILPGSAFVAADVDLPYSGKVVDGHTLTAESVRLYRTRDGQAVSAVVNTSGAGDAIVLRPIQPLETNTQYTFEVTAKATDTGGHSFRPYQATFWTAAGEKLSDFPAAFERVSPPIASGHMFTCVIMGPDHNLYASTLSGLIFRYELSADGAVVAASQIDTVNRANGNARLITGMVFDPSSTPEAPVLWVSHGELPPEGEKGQAFIRGATEWTGKISTLSGPDFQQYHDIVVGLPRAWKDHLNNQPVFGPDGALYFCQAANTAMGAPDHKWGFRPERLLTAAILRLDVKALQSRTDPLDVQTGCGHTYDPYAPGAPLTLYATGIRNSFDLCWHSNGHLYGGINGSAAGGNAPAGPPVAPDSAASRRVPALNNIQQTEDDTLLDIVPGGYYGHPNPTRAEYVLNGGNPAPKGNAYQVDAYPLGTPPDRNWRLPIFSFGKNLSPCGMVEYHSATFGGALKGKLLCVRYSGGDDIQAISFNANGNVAEAITGIEGFGRFINPVDLTEDTANGNLYVAEFGGKRITLLRPVRSDGLAAISHRACRVHFNATALSSGQD